MTLFLKKEQSVYAMSKNNQPVAQAKSGDTIIFETYDCFTNQITDEQNTLEKLDFQRVNPATGPVFIEDAQVGDILAVTIEEINITSDKVTLFTGPNVGVMGDELQETTIMRLPIEGEKITFSENIQIPVHKMVGVIGTAPKDEDVLCGSPGEHGGNLDCKEITEGTTVYLPVFVPGGLLALGDCHAAMGDGEVSVCGGEVPAEVKVTVEVLKNVDVPTPFLIRNGKLSTFASTESLDDATSHATKKMVTFVQKYTQLTKGESIHLLSLVGDLRIAQIVNPKKTARMELDLSYLGDLKLS